MTGTVDLQTFIGSIQSAFPEHRHARFAHLAEGWDSAAVDVDDRFVFKFPKNVAAAVSLAREARLLSLIRPAVTLRVPELELCTVPRLMTRHRKIPGDHLLSAQYCMLEEGNKQRLAGELAQFYAELHALDAKMIRDADAGPVKSWLAIDIMERCAATLLPAAHRPVASRILKDFGALGVDPFGQTFGFFDGHGWNMAFDHATQRLNGIYDFADAGFGPLHQEFVYSSFISPDLTRHIMASYEHHTRKHLDRRRIWILTAVLRLSELAAAADDPTALPDRLQSALNRIIQDCGNMA